jgi:hypothetical protein
MASVGQFGLRKAAAMPSYSTKTPLRFALIAAGLWLSVASAIAQNALDIALTLNPAQVAEITRLIDLQPISTAPPAAFWNLQATIDKALQANPDALRAVLSLRSATR